MIVTTCDRNYLIGFEVMLKSLLETNPRVAEEAIEFRVISNDLSESDLATAMRIHTNVTLQRYDESKYASIPASDGDRKFGDYSKFEAFKVEADRVVFLDCDTLVLGNIDLLLDFQGGIAAARDLYIDQYNTGVMAMNGDVISEKTFSDLVHLASLFGRTEHLDQDIINKYFHDEMREIPVSYNFLKTYHKPVFRNSEMARHIRILHYIAKKPWQNIQPVALEEGTLWLERCWFDVYARVMRIKSKVQSSMVSETP
jgi:lipopolysaccharide biosynthesis glycosyltransferase